MKKQQLMTPFSTRQYMFSKDYEIYYYSDRPENAVSEHTHDYYEFYFFLEGNINIRVEGKPINIQPGDFLVIPPGVRHNPEFLDNTTPYRRFVLWISTDYCKHLMVQAPEFGYLCQLSSTAKEYRFSNDVMSANEITAAMFTIIEEIKGSRFGRDAMVSSRINLLLMMLNRLVYESRNVAGASAKARLSTVLADFINAHLEEDLTLERLEKEFFVSRYHIEHVFKEDYGISLHKYIQMKRLYACRDAIGSHKSIQETYLMYGFKDYSVFFKAFKKEFGISPREYQLIQ